MLIITMRIWYITRNALHNMEHEMTYNLEQQKQMSKSKAIKQKN